MGGFGSGRWGWRWTRETTDGLLWLDVRDLARRGNLAAPPGCEAIGTLSWTRRGEPAGSIAVRYRASDPDAIVLDYRTRGPGDGEWRDVRERVRLDRTPCHYGGSRPWFLCPGCGARRAVLYSVGGRFRCTRCHDLAHASTREQPWDRATRRADKLRRRIGCEPGWHSVPWKPKGMHWRTY